MVDAVSSLPRHGATAITRILLVDDDDDFLESAELLLGTIRGVRVVGRARSGEDAITAVESLRPDLVLMDHVMPGTSGIEATRAIKARPGAPRVIILTSHDRADVRAAAEAAGADGFLSKLDFASAVTAMQPPPPPASSEP